jgi:hypothetical protein
MEQTSCTILGKMAQKKMKRYQMLVFAVEEQLQQVGLLVMVVQLKTGTIQPGNLMTKTMVERRSMTLTNHIGAEVVVAAECTAVAKLRSTRPEFSTADWISRQWAEQLFGWPRAT